MIEVETRVEGRTSGKLTKRLAAAQVLAGEAGVAEI